MYPVANSTNALRSRLHDEGGGVAARLRRRRSAVGSIAGSIKVCAVIADLAMVGVASWERLRGLDRDVDRDVDLDLLDRDVDLDLLDREEGREPDWTKPAACRPGPGPCFAFDGDLCRCRAWCMDMDGRC